jgi:hypothetical protein
MKFAETSSNDEKHIKDEDRSLTKRKEPCSASLQGHNRIKIQLIQII